MKSDTSKLSARQLLALPLIAAEPTIEGAAEKIGVTRKTLYQWLKQEPFRLALEEARKEFVESGFRTLRLAVRKAADKIVSHLDCADESVSLRAAQDIIRFTQKAIEFEELERRISALENAVKDRKERAWTLKSA